MSKLVFFSASDGVHGIELWVTDGTSSGTRMVKDILPPEANPFDDPYFDSSDPGYLVPIGGGRILFRAQDENFRRTELWVSDGTEEGTALLIDLDPDSSATPSYLTPLGDGRVVFSASGADDDGTELWITDGTAAGTQKLKTINPNEDYPYSSHPYGFKQVANGRLIFTADDGSNGRELWTTDGTPDGTYMLREFNLGSGNSNISSNNYLDLPGGRVAFSAFDGTDYNYWVTDGTAGGTTRLGGSEFTSDQHEMPGGRLLIKGAYADGKYPFYVSDGTIEGTKSTHR
jgi:ELWxxDGT repeat protein